jgi:4-aminobutyrate aminotransferase-like enzyme
MSERYGQSATLLARAEQMIQLGSQTFSKSHINFHYGAAPLFIERGQGVKVWDVDSNEYLDFASDLDYCDTHVNQAMMKNIHLGNRNLNLANSEANIARLLEVYAEVLPELIRLDAEKAILQALDGEPIQPVFKVR